MEYLFDCCYSLSSIPDVSKLNTNNVTNMHKMFYNCKSLFSLPDISNWNTNNNVTKMDKMFYGCSSLFIYLIFQNGIIFCFSFSLSKKS